MGPITALRQIRPVRNVDAGDLLESFLVYGVASIIGIRVYLELTGYPQVGGGGLHIAHMLWGGLLMLIALVLLLAFLGKGVVGLAAVLGGLGFGIFIDELGKFITSDNNYLFKPTFALIYIIFMTLFLAFRAIERRTTLSSEESLVNAVDLLKEAVRNDLDNREREQALQLLQQSDPSNPIVGALERLLREAKPLPNRQPMLPVRLGRWAHAKYERLVSQRWFPPVLIGIFAVVAILDIAGLASAIASDPDFRSGHPDMGFVDWADMISSFAFGALVVIGIGRLPRSRVQAFTWFKRAILVSIFFSQPFYFYSEQLWAATHVAINLLLLLALNYTLSEEEEQAGAAEIRAAGSASAPALGG